MDISEIYNVVINKSDNKKTFVINKSKSFISKELSINPMYLILENGMLWNNVRKKFLKPSQHSKNKPDFYVYDIFNLLTNRREKIAKHRLQKFEFGNYKGKHSNLSKISIL